MFRQFLQKGNKPHTPKHFNAVKKSNVICLQLCFIPNLKFVTALCFAIILPAGAIIASLLVYEAGCMSGKHYNYR